METKVCIIGAGPAGLISAVFAAKNGATVAVFEKNATAGRKLLLTGGGRCNLTHTGTVDNFVRAYGKQGRFLRYCLHELSPDMTREFFKTIGVRTKVDPASSTRDFAVASGCVFPVSESARDVRDALLRQCQKLDVQLQFGRGVKRIEKRGSEFFVFVGGEPIVFQKVIIAAGGLSYTQTGSTGDGYILAKSLGHTIIDPKPALVPLIADEKWCADLTGVSLDNVQLSAVLGDKKTKIAGPMIFTHDGIGGPAVLDLSRLLADYLPKRKPIEIVIDVIPAMNETGFEKYLMEQLSQHARKIAVNVLLDLVPKRLAGLICRQAKIAGTTGSQLKKEQRRGLIRLLKNLSLSITASRPIEEATITRGGIATNEIDPKTMQSKVCPGLFFAGEMIDIDGPCGGYNLQICWSTGALAGKI